MVVNPRKTVVYHIESSPRFPDEQVLQNHHFPGCLCPSHRVKMLEKWGREERWGDHDPPGHEFFCNTLGMPHWSKANPCYQCNCHKEKGRSPPGLLLPSWWWTCGLFRQLFSCFSKDSWPLAGLSLMTRKLHHLQCLRFQQRSGYDPVHPCWTCCIILWLLSGNLYQWTSCQGKVPAFMCLCLTSVAIFNVEGDHFKTPERRRVVNGIYSHLLGSLCRYICWFTQGEKGKAKGKNHGKGP